MSVHSKTYIFVAGKSGGHIIPGLTRARMLHEQEQACILFITTTGDLDQRLLKDQTWLTHYSIHLPTYSLRKLIRFVWYYIPVQLKLIALLYKVKPSAIHAMGGYPSIPVCIAGWLWRIPYFLYEFNVEPGQAITVLAPYADKVYMCYNKTRDFLPRARCELAQYPVRFTHKASAKTGTQPTLLIVGGSQGSQALNNFMLTLVPQLAQKFTIIHQTGAQDFIRVRDFYHQQNVQAMVFDFAENMEHYYAQAEMVIARAGAGTLFELLFFEKKSIIIPLITQSTAHQKENAHHMALEHPKLFYVLEQEAVEQNIQLLYNQIQALADSK